MLLSVTLEIRVTRPGSAEAAPISHDQVGRSTFFLSMAPDVFRERLDSATKEAEGSLPESRCGSVCSLCAVAPGFLFTTDILVEFDLWFI